MSEDVMNITEEVGSKVEDLSIDSPSESLKRAMSFTVERVLPLPKQWDPKAIEDVEFPPDLTALDIGKLGYLMSAWSSIMAYAQFEVAKADVERTARENQLDWEIRYKIAKLMSEGISEDKARAQVLGDPKVAKFKMRFEYARAKYVLMNALLKGYFRYYTALSRELSRRGMNAPGESVTSGDGDYPDTEEW